VQTAKNMVNADGFNNFVCVCAYLSLLTAACLARCALSAAMPDVAVRPGPGPGADLPDPPASEPAITVLLLLLTCTSSSCARTVRVHG